jgi:hypothetical protein
MEHRAKDGTASPFGPSFLKNQDHRHRLLLPRPLSDPLRASPASLLLSEPTSGKAACGRLSTYATGYFVS